MLVRVPLDFLAWSLADMSLQMLGTWGVEEDREMSFGCDIIQSTADAIDEN